MVPCSLTKPKNEFLKSTNRFLHHHTPAPCPGKPIIITENGAWSKLGNRGSKNRPNTEDWHADLLRRHYLPQ